jgi:hypothetical protein
MDINNIMSRRDLTLAITCGNGMKGGNELLDRLSNVTFNLWLSGRRRLRNLLQNPCHLPFAVKSFCSLDATCIKGLDMGSAIWIEVDD